MRTKGVVGALLVFLGLLFVVQVLGLVKKEGFVPGDAREQYAPCMSDAECASNRCSQGKCM
jgi:hypothetical protein